MATSAVQIVNRALHALGHKPITAFEDDAKAARLATRDYDTIRDAVLQAHPWNFAIRRKSLAAATEAPDWGFERAFDFPADPYCLRVLAVSGEDPESGRWVVEGRQILTDFNAPLPIRYVARVTDVGLYTPLFVEALAARLAWDWAEMIPGTNSKAQLAKDWYERKLSEARSIDGQEGSVEVIEAYGWVDSRFQGGNLGAPQRLDDVEW